MSRQHTPGRWLLALGLCVLLLADGPALASAKDRGAAPASGTRAYARTVGPKLLAAQRWQEAGEAYHGWDDELEQAVRLALASPSGTTPLGRDRFTFRLLTFYFRHADLTRDLWRRGLDDLLEHAQGYVALLPRVPAVERREALDFTGLGQLRQLSQRFRITPADRKDLAGALKAHPESLPLTVAYLFCLEWVNSDDRPQACAEAMTVLSSRPGKLLLARALRGRTTDTPAAIRRDALRAGWELAPSDAEKAFLLHALAVVLDGQSKDKDDRSARREALTLAVRVYEEFPRTPGAAESRPLAVALTLRWLGPRAALVLLRQLQRSGPEQQVGLEVALCQLARHFSRQGQPDRSSALFREVVQGHARTPAIADAALGLAENAFALNEPKQALDWLRRCASLAIPERPPGTADPRSQAAERLALWYAELAQWDQAARWWQRWEPRHEERIILAALRAEREKHLTYCRMRADLQKGAHAAGVRTALAALRREEPVFGWAAADLVRLYREAGQEQDLLLMVGELERAVQSDRRKLAVGREEQQDNSTFLPAQAVRELMKVAQLRERKDVAALVKLLTPPPAESSESVQALHTALAWAASEALGRCGGAEVGPLRELLQEEQAPYWAVEALGWSRAPGALELLAHVAERHQQKDPEGLSSAIARAIARHGQAGKRLLERLAEPSEGPMRAAARERLMLLAEGGPSANPWPRPRAGSLPSSLYE
ncbi:MAG: hypothetical protein L0Z62_08010 [Gemmataceae bacterium]|nr:hypothetical protein [Gemmataceae bacterium]